MFYYLSYLRQNFYRQNNVPKRGRRRLTQTGADIGMKPQWEKWEDPSAWQQRLFLKSDWLKTKFFSHLIGRWPIEGEIIFKQVDLCFAKERVDIMVHRVSTRGAFFNISFGISISVGAPISLSLKYQPQRIISMISRYLRNNCSVHIYWNGKMNGFQQLF